jgi:hypothetical protein
MRCNPTRASAPARRNGRALSASTRLGALAFTCWLNGACATAAPPPAADPRPGYREACVHGECAEGLRCRYLGEPGAMRSVCDLDVGRCRFDGECTPGLACLRFGPRLGVCTARGI